MAGGAEHVLYTSHMGASPTSPFPPMPDHAATDAALGRAGVPFTALHNGFYAPTVPLLLRGAVESGELRVPGSGPFSWTAHADLADAAAIALVDGGLHGITPPLTGFESLDLDDVAALASRVTGRTVRHVEVPDEEYRSGLLGRGLPDTAADMLVGMFAASRRGDFAAVDPTLPRLLGRPATPLADVLRRHLSPAGT